MRVVVDAVEMSSMRAMSIERTMRPARCSRSRKRSATRSVSFMRMDERVRARIAVSAER